MIKVRDTTKSVHVTHKVIEEAEKDISDGLIKIFFLTESTTLMTGEENFRYGLVAETDKSQRILKGKVTYLRYIHGMVS